MISTDALLASQFLLLIIEKKTVGSLMKMKNNVIFLSIEVIQNSLYAGFFLLNNYMCSRYIQWILKIDLCIVVVNSTHEKI